MILAIAVIGFSIPLLGAAGWLLYVLWRFDPLDFLDRIDVPVTGECTSSNRRQAGGVILADQCLAASPRPANSPITAGLAARGR